MDINIIEESKLWIELSKEDLNVSKKLLVSSHFSNAVYHAQQSSEKVLKAVLSLVLVFSENTSITLPLISMMSYIKIFQMN